MEKKSLFLSKTVWMNLVMALAAFFPPVQEWIMGNPETYALAWSVINMGLRLITKQELHLK
jgi:hypothetical protein